MCYCILQLYDLGNEHGRREFLDDLFTFMQKRGKVVTGRPIKRCNRHNKDFERKILLYILTKKQ